MRRPLSYEVDFLVFAKMFFYGIDTTDEYRKQKLNMFKHQIEALEHIHENKFSVIHKSRQARMDSAMALYVAWNILFKDDYRVLYVTQNQRMGADFMKKVKDIINFYHSSKVYKRELLIEKVGHPTVERLIENPNIINGGTKFTTPWNSVLQIVGESNNAGRGCRHNMIIMNEAAYMKNAAEMCMYLIPTMSAVVYDSKFIIYSTNNGTNGFFYDVCKNAGKKNDFKLLKIP